MAGKVIDKDKGMRDIQKRLKNLKGQKHVVIGILGSGDVDGFSLADIATVHEFGSEDGHIPQRSFLRSTHDKKLKENQALLKKLKSKLLKEDTDKVLNTIGSVIQGQIVEAINNGIGPPLKSQTIKRKGSSKPLIDTGHLKASITFEVRK